LHAEVSPSIKVDGLAVQHVIHFNYSTTINRVNKCQ
jgi:hypothetical protein